MINVQVIVTGMHRSGTSILSNWLSKCGLNLGDELLGSDFSNLDGHFEDLDFLNFHKGILKSNNVNNFTACNFDLHINGYYYKKSKFLIEFKNSLRPQWGWKDPRTCLFLEFWDKNLDNPKYIFIWRDCESVVNSLIKRELGRDKSIWSFAKNYIKKSGRYNKYNAVVDLYISSWINYNANIIKFCKNIKKDNYIIINYEDLTCNTNKAFTFCSNEWLIHLEEYDINKIILNEIKNRNNRYSKKFGSQFRGRQAETQAIEEEIRKL